MTAAHPATQEFVTPDELLELWPILDPEEQVEGFRHLDREAAEFFFLNRATVGQATLILGLPEGERRLWVRLLAPDDLADVLQIVPSARRTELIALLDEPTRHEVQALLAYAEDEAGGLMNPRYARMRPEMRVDEALRYLRQHARRKTEAIYYAFVVGPDDRLLGVLSFKELMLAPADQPVERVMR